MSVDWSVAAGTLAGSIGLTIASLSDTTNLQGKQSSYKEGQENQEAGLLP